MFLDNAYVPQKKYLVRKFISDYISYVTQRSEEEGNHFNYKEELKKLQQENRKLDFILRPSKKNSILGW